MVWPLPCSSIPPTPTPHSRYVTGKLNAHVFREGYWRFRAHGIIIDNVNEKLLCGLVQKALGKTTCETNLKRTEKGGKILNTARVQKASSISNDYAIYRLEQDNLRDKRWLFTPGWIYVRLIHRHPFFCSGWQHNRWGRILPRNSYNPYNEARSKYTRWPWRTVHNTIHKTEIAPANSIDKIQEGMN